MGNKLQVDVKCLLDVRNQLGESPVWSVHEASLYWVDILGQRLHRLRMQDQRHDTWTVPAPIGSIGLRAQGGLVMALRSGFHLFDLDTHKLTALAHPELHIPSNRFNDGKVSPDGRFFAGTMDDRPEKQEVASLYCLDPDHNYRWIAGGLKVSNGLAWSPDGKTLYHSDSRASAIYCYDYDADSGAVSNRRVFAALEPEWGRPDGAAVDVQGCYWSCGITRGRINRFSPAGELIEYIELPVSHPTMPCFGGPNMSTLFVTSLRAEVPADLLPSTPLAGAVFQIELNVAGVPVGQYLG